MEKQRKSSDLLEVRQMRKSKFRSNHYFEESWAFMAVVCLHLKRTWQKNNAGKTNDFRSYPTMLPGRLGIPGRFAHPFHLPVHLSIYYLSILLSPMPSSPPSSLSGFIYMPQIWHQTYSASRWQPFQSLPATENRVSIPYLSRVVDNFLRYMRIVRWEIQAI